MSILDERLLLATEEFLQAMINGCTVLYISDTTKNLFGFWVDAGIPIINLKRPVEFLSKMNRVNQMEYHARNDDTLLALQQQKLDIEKEYGMQTHEAIMELILILKGFVAKGD